MCGISGFNWEDKVRIEAMTHDLAHRGPDATGVFLDRGVSLGHNRLSIIDLSRGADQPMTDNAGELAVVFNGEIYNFRELREELAGDYTFKTKGDTEVILAGYRRWGRAVVEKLNGMFAFAIYDKRDGSLFCARDRMGIKPFYYFWDGKRFIFASELRAILTHHDVPHTLDQASFNHYFRVLYTPAPSTMINSISVLSPAHTLTLKGTDLSLQAYDTSPVEAANLPYADATKALREKVIASVERHLVADVPVGVYLSGGIDSSVVLASMARSHRDIKTFTIGFRLGEGEEGKKFNHDAELAKQTAAHFGTEHHELIITAQDALDSFEEVIAHNSDPVSNPTSIAMLRLARFAKSQVSVAMTGNAGDELFGGYDRYRMALLAEQYQKLPAFARALGDQHPRVKKLNQSGIDLFAQFMFQKDDRLARVISPNVFQDDAFTKRFFAERWDALSGDIPERLMQMDQKNWLPDHFFTLADKMSMASALEERVPLADKELLDFSRALPRSYKLDLFNTKKILKDAFRSDLPGFLFNQPKRGWFSPAAKWLRDPAFSAFAREVLSEGYYEGTRSLFDWSEARRMLEEHIDKTEYNLSIVWALMTFQVWARMYRIHL